MSVSSSSVRFARSTSEHEIYSYSSNSTALIFTGGELKTKETACSGGHGIRVLDNGRVGFGYCQNGKDIKKTIKEAKTSSKFSVGTNFSFAPKSAFTKLDIFDQSLDFPDPAMLKEFVDCARSSTEANGGKSKVICSTTSSSTSIENTAGFCGEYKKSIFSIYSECMDSDGFGFASWTSLKKPDVEKAKEVGAKAALLAKQMQGAKKPEPGSYRLVVAVEAIDSILGPLLASFSGDWKRRGITRLELKKMFSEKLSISDDATAPAVEACPFDDEGTPSRKRFLVKEGEVKSFLFDRETAALAKVPDKEAGYCARPSYSAPPGISTSNIVIDKGKCNDLAELGPHIEFLSGHGSHTANLTSGDIGLEVSNAFLADAKGEKKPIKGFMISANLFDLFANIEEIESRQQTYGSLISPRIAFGSVKVVS